MAHADKPKFHDTSGESSASLAVFNEILFEAPVPRSDIARRTNLTPATVSRVTRQLIDAGLIEEFQEKKTGRPGRSNIDLRLKKDAGYVVGISVNAFEQRVAIANLNRDIVGELPLPRDRILDPHKAADVAAAHVEKLLQKYRVPRSRVFNVGVASAGVVNSETGIVTHAPTIDWTNVPLGVQIKERLGLPVSIDSLVNALAAAEYSFGVAAKFRDFVVVHATLGIGMGIVTDGRPVRGHQSHAGLIGQTQLVQSDKGNNRELNFVAGGATIFSRWAKERSIAPAEVQESHILELIEAANAGNKSAVSLCEDGADYLARIVAIIAKALDSEAIMLVGPMVRINVYRERLEFVLRKLVGDHLKLTVSTRRGVDSACMLAISEIAKSGIHLRMLQQ